MNKPNLTCGIAFNFHDSSVSFAENKKIKLVLEAERVFRKKKMSCSPQEMETLIRTGLRLMKRNVDEVSYWALATLRNPWISFEDSFPNPPVWRDIKILGKNRRVLVVNHHLSHASAYLFSPFNNSVVISCDGGGDRGERFSVFKTDDSSLTKEEIGFDDYITAKPYDLISTYLYNAPMCEGKLMALSAYGEPQERHISTLEALIPALNKIYYDESDKLLSLIFPGLKGAASHTNREACNLAASLHYSFVQHRLKDIERISKRYNTPNLVLVGGACLNLEVNSEVWRRGLSRSDPFIPPCCDDTGQSLGALAYLINEVYGKPQANLPYTGKGPKNIDLSEEVLDTLVQDLLDNKFLLIHNSKAEIGPRALGNRSFIARPDNLDVKEIVQSIKGRERYRPVAPITLEEKVPEYFIGPSSSPFMLHQYMINPSKTEQIKSVIHRNQTARTQTVTPNSNFFMYELIKRFGDRTGTYVLVNPSLNLKGEPLSNTIQDTQSISQKIPYTHRVIYNGRIIR